MRCVSFCSEIPLTEEAAAAIGEFYTELRSSSEARALPVTVCHQYKAPYLHAPQPQLVATPQIHCIHNKLRSTQQVRLCNVEHPAPACQVRTLETIIRLSTAAAKARLAGQVAARDVDTARGILAEVLNSDAAGEQPSPGERRQDPVTFV